MYQNTYNQQQYPVMGAPMYPAMGNFYQQPAAAALKEENVLDEKEIAELRQKHGRINFLPTREEILKALCTHRHNGVFSMKQEAIDSNVWVCQICGERVDLSASYSHDTCQQVVDYLNSAFNAMKVKNNGTVSNDIMKSMGQAMVLVKRLPAMTELVDRNFTRVDQAAQGVYNGYMTGAQQAIGTILGNGGSMPYNPSYMAPMGMPAMPGMPMGMPGMQPAGSVYANQMGGTIMESQAIGNPFMGPVQVMPNGMPMTMAPMQQQMAPQMMQQQVMTPNGLMVVNVPVGAPGVVPAAPQVMDPLAGNAMVQSAPAGYDPNAVQATQAQSAQGQTTQAQAPTGNIVNTKTFNV